MRNQERFKIESPAFYLNLILCAWKTKLPRPLALTALLIISQLANALGRFFDWLWSVDSGNRSWVMPLERVTPRRDWCAWSTIVADISIRQIVSAGRLYDTGRCNQESKRCGHGGAARSRLENILSSASELPGAFGRQFRGGRFADSYRNQWLTLCNSISQNGPPGSSVEDGYAAGCSSTLSSRKFQTTFRTAQMTIKLNTISKSFMVSGRSRRPLYRELINLGSRRRSENNKEVPNNINLDIPDGSRVALIGHNGAGKSSLLRLIAGIYKPNSGTVQVDGRLCCFLEPGAGAASALTSFPSSSQIVLQASHDHQLMRRTCPLAIFIDGGAIRYFGATQEVLDLYHREPGNE